MGTGNGLEDKHPRCECFHPSLHGSKQWKDREVEILAEGLVGNSIHIVPACSVFARRGEFKAVCSRCRVISQINEPLKARCKKCGNTLSLSSCFGFSKENPEMNSEQKMGWELCLPFLETLYFVSSGNVAMTEWVRLARTLAGEGLLQTGIPRKDVIVGSIYHTGSCGAWDNDGELMLWSNQGQKFGPLISAYGHEIIRVRVSPKRAEQAQARVVELQKMSDDERQACWFEAEAKLLRTKIKAGK